MASYPGVGEAAAVPSCSLVFAAARLFQFKTISPQQQRWKTRPTVNVSVLHWFCLNAFTHSDVPLKLWFDFRSVWLYTNQTLKKRSLGTNQRSFSRQTNAVVPDVNVPALNVSVCLTSCSCQWCKWSASFVHSLSRWCSFSALRCTSSASSWIGGIHHFVEQIRRDESQVFINRCDLYRCTLWSCRSSRFTWEGFSFQTVKSTL